MPESERSFGVAGEHNVARKHFRINGRIVDGNDLAVGFAWKVCTENSAKQPNEYPIDSIIADSDGIEFDWLVGKGALTYKGSLKFAVCAKQVNGEGKVQHEWHSRIGTGTVYDGIEASAEDIGGFDLRAYIQQTAAEVRQAVQDAAASAKNAETQASDANKAAKSAADNATAAKKSADDAAAAAKTAGDAATKAIEEGVAEKLTEMQNIQKDVSTKAQTAETAAKNAGTAKTAAQNAQNAAEKSAGNAANSESAAKTSAEQAAAARDTAQELAGRVHRHTVSFFTVICYLTIGPFFAIPRTGSVSYEIAVRPFLQSGGSDMIMTGFLVCSSLFLLAVRIAAETGRPHRQDLTPALLLTICCSLPNPSLRPLGSPQDPTAAYATASIAAVQGVLDGYNTMDAIASLVFAILVIEFVMEDGATEPAAITKEVFKAGLIAVGCLALSTFSSPRSVPTASLLSVSRKRAHRSSPRAP